FAVLVTYARTVPRSSLVSRRHYVCFPLRSLPTRRSSDLPTRIPASSAPRGGVGAAPWVLPKARHAGVAEGLEPHLLEADIAGENEQIGPGNLLALLPLHRPHGGPRPAGRCPALSSEGAKRCWPWSPPPRSGRTRRWRRGPGHADHERAVLAEVSRPPFLIRLLQLLDIGLELLAVEAVELGFVIDIRIHGVACGLPLGEDPEGEADDKGALGMRAQRCPRKKTRGVNGGRTHTATR